MSAWVDDSKGGAYRIVGLLALRVRATDQRRKWWVSVEVAPAVRMVADLHDGHSAPDVRAVRGREPGRVVVPAWLVQGGRPRAMQEAARMALQLVLDEAIALERLA